MSDANAAADRLNVLIRKNGRDFLRMPASVKAYLGQELATFPEEKAVLEAAFDAGVHDQVRKLNGENREIHLQNVAERFAKRANVHPDWARWACNVWSAALSERSQTPRTFSVEPANSYRTTNAAIENRYDQDPQLKILRGGSPIWVKLILTCIVVAGGFTGAFIGRSWPMATILLGFDLVDSTIGKEEFDKIFPSNQPKPTAFQKVIGYIVFFALFSTPAAISAAIGSMAGWWFGRADGRPWLGFSACFGAAFIVNTILVMTLGCFAGVVTTFFVCFAAAFKIATSTT